jgi:hypothetical protein
MTEEDDEFNRIEREAAMRMEAVSATVAKREWVGLTPHERMMCRSFDADETVAKTEAKLREKNT